MSKLNRKVILCLDPARLNQTLIRPVHRVPTLDNIFLILNNTQYHSLIDASSGYHNLKFDERSSYLTTFMCQFGRYRYKRLLFGATLAGDMFKRNIDKIFKDLPNVFGITDYILVVGYDRDGKDHDATLQRVLHICRQVNLKLNKDKCCFRCIQALYCGTIIPRKDLKPDPWKLKAMMEMPPPK